MEVVITSHKLIKPSKPTPPHLQKYNLSFLDQIAAPVHVNIIFYYHRSLNIDHLEKSLSETLTVFYPLAGRYTKGDMFVDCNDQGVAFVQAQVVNLQLDQLLHGKFEVGLLNKFVPWHINKADHALTPLVSVQVSSFSCGGAAVCLRISHQIADGSTFASFVSAWSTASRDGIDQVVKPFFDLPSHIPARILPAPKQITSRKAVAKVVTRRFVFNGVAITKLKTDIGCQATRVQVVTAVIWKAFINLSLAKHGNLKTSLLEQAVNLRGRTVPPMPPNTFANFIALALPRVSGNELDKMDLLSLVKLLQDAVKSTSNKLLHSEEFYTMVSSSFKEVDEDLNHDEVDYRMFSSWCRVPLYEADFGWGKPSWISSISMSLEITVLIDTKDGDGIEAWVSLDEADMLGFQQDQNIKAFSLKNV